MGRLIRLLAANRDIKIQECGKQDTAERGGSISGCGQSESDPFARSWRISNTAFAVLCSERPISEIRECV